MGIFQGDAVNTLKNRFNFQKFYVIICENKFKGNL